MIFFVVATSKGFHHIICVHYSLHVHTVYASLQKTETTVCGFSPFQIRERKKNFHKRKRKLNKHLKSEKL